VAAVNEELTDTPELVNQDPFGAAWFFRVRLADPKELDTLMDATAYQVQVESEEH
jgi:glycine cleavage system H protein